MTEIYAVRDSWEDGEPYLGFFSTEELAEDYINSLCQIDYESALNAYNKQYNGAQANIDRLRKNLNISDSISDETIAKNYAGWQWAFPKPIRTRDEYLKWKRAWFRIENITLDERN